MILLVARISGRLIVALTTSPGDPTPRLVVMSFCCTGSGERRLIFKLTKVPEAEWTYRVQGGGKFWKLGVNEGMEVSNNKEIKIFAYEDEECTAEKQKASGSFTPKLDKKAMFAQETVVKLQAGEEELDVHISVGPEGPE